MKKIYFEIIVAAALVAIPTLIVYRWLEKIGEFWNAQNFWSITLIICWAVVAYGYYNQGWIVRKARSSTHVSTILPTTVFFVQCILFVKGIFYHDYALIAGAIMVNSGVVFVLYQILRFKKNSPKINI